VFPVHVTYHISHRISVWCCGCHGLRGPSSSGERLCRGQGQCFLCMSHRIVFGGDFYFEGACGPTAAGSGTAKECWYASMRPFVLNQ
jgi:hypothetical protein